MYVVSKQQKIEEDDKLKNSKKLIIINTKERNYEKKNRE